MGKSGIVHMDNGQKDNIDGPGGMYTKTFNVGKLGYQRRRLHRAHIKVDTSDFVLKKIIVWPKMLEIFRS